MTKETLLMQYQSKCLSALKSVVKNDVVLYYPILEKKTGKRGHPKWFDGRIDFVNLDLTRCKEYEVNKGKLYGLRVYAKALKRYVSLAIWYPMDGRTDKWHLYFSTYDSMDGREVLDYYRTRFQLESLTVSQLTLESWIFTSMHRWLPSTWPKRHIRGSELSIPSPLASHSYTMLICLNDLFACSGLTQTRKLLTYFSKN